jgi:hypothetical protein
MAAVSHTCIPACTACTRCRRACARCAAPPPPGSPAPRSRSATASAACSPPPARSSWRTRHREGPSSIACDALPSQPPRRQSSAKEGEIVHISSPTVKVIPVVDRRGCRGLPKSAKARRCGNGGILAGHCLVLPAQIGNSIHGSVRSRSMGQKS